MDKPKRNQPCACGSGRKYKRCCINAAWHGPVCRPNHIGYNTEEYLHIWGEESIRSNQRLAAFIGLAAGLRP